MHIWFKKKNVPKKKTYVVSLVCTVLLCLLLAFAQFVLCIQTGDAAVASNAFGDLEANTIISGTAGGGGEACKAEDDGPFSGGDGTSEYPFLISTPEDLDNIRNYLYWPWMISPYHFELTNDIDLADYLSENPSGAYPEGGPGWNDGKGWQPIGMIEDESIYQNAFQSYIDGKGYKIKNLWIDRKDAEYVGLFGYCYRASIKNLSITIHEKGINGGTYAGVLAGRIDGDASTAARGTVSRCAATGNVSATGTAGGLVGVGDRLEVVESYFNGTVSAGKDAGGLVGETRVAAEIENSYAIGDVKTSASDGFCFAGGILGLGDGETIVEDCYAVTKEQEKCGGILGAVTAPSGDRFDGVELAKCFFNDESGNRKAVYAFPDRVVLTNVSGVLLDKLKESATFASFKGDIWGIFEDKGFPYLKNINTVALFVPSAKTFDGKSDFSGRFTVSGTVSQSEKEILTSNTEVKAKNGTDMKNAGAYEVEFLHSTEANIGIYQVSYAPFEVGKKTVTVKANDSKRRPKSTDAVFGYTIFGLEEGDSAENIILSGEAVFATNANKESGEGEYKIFATIGTLVSQNYDFVYEAGTLKIEGLSVSAIVGMSLGISLPVVALGVFLVVWFLVKKKSFADLKSAVVKLFSKQTVHHADMSQTGESAPVNGSDSKEKIPLPDTLSPREVEVMLLLLEGLSRKDIAGRLFISDETVKKHTANIFEKTGVHSQKELMMCYRSQEIAKES